MVFEIQCCVNSTNQHAQHPSPAPEISGPLKKYYLASRDFLRGKFVPGTLFRSWFLQWKHTKYRSKVPIVPGESSCIGKGTIHRFPCSTGSLLPIGHVVVVDIVLWSLLAESDFHWQQPSWLDIVFLIRANNHTSKCVAHSITLEHNSLMFQIIVMSPLVNFTRWLGQR